MEVPTPSTTSPPIVSEEVPILVIRAAKALVERMSELTGSEADRGAVKLTVMHGLAARYIAANERVTTVELAAHLHVTKQSAAELVHALEAVDIVARRPHPTDRRARVLELTANGRRRLAESRTRWAAIEAEWVELVGPAALDQLRTVLETYLAAGAPEAQDP